MILKNNPVFICNFTVKTYKYKNDSISGKIICRHTFEKISLLRNVSTAVFIYFVCDSIMLIFMIIVAKGIDWPMGHFFNFICKLYLSFPDVC